MNIFLLVLFFGVFVVLVELFFENLVFVEFLDEEGEEIIGELKEVENDFFFLE